MPRVHKQEYWSFVRLVAPSTKMPPGQTAWKTMDAELAYCLKCEITFKYKSGSSASNRNHMTHEHPLELGNAGQDTAVKRVTNALASKRESSAVIFFPTKRRKKINPAEEEMTTRALIECTFALPILHYHLFLRASSKAPTQEQAIPPIVVTQTMRSTSALLFTATILHACNDVLSAVADKDTSKLDKALAPTSILLAPSHRS
ncbi:hypothetical protein GN244_ATG18736 [Phytophthora infestans]|uniref:BED-type domain-containing protein n=1 Tax=Phytophthora infestans TaxID=4787 RepID=A0A833SN69_PHYIN|nr:hypothetical protein GN244_ATG18736 [Phytophthora infestans]KAF4131846.1 hypothetical protein GN958_ATG18879 [Phytophthora infestans]